MSPETLHFISKCTKMRLVVGLRPDPLRSLQCSPRPLAGLNEGGEESGKGRGKERKEEGKGGRERGKNERGNPQCLKCVDAHAAGP